MARPRRCGSWAGSAQARLAHKRCKDPVSRYQAMPGASSDEKPGVKQEEGARRAGARPTTGRQLPNNQGPEAEVVGLAHQGEGPPRTQEDQGAKHHARRATHPGAHGPPEAPKGQGARHQARQGHSAPTSHRHGPALHSPLPGTPTADLAPRCGDGVRAVPAMPSAWRMGDGVSRRGSGNHRCPRVYVSACP